MKVCLIAYHFPPDPAVGSLRALKVARAFRDAGHEVHVISVQTSAPRKPWSEPGIEVQRVRSSLTVRELYAALKSRLERRRDARIASEVKEVEGWAAPTRVAGWRRFVYSLIWLPDDQQGFIGPAYRAARAVGLTETDLIYSTCPPYSPHLAALLTKWRTGARWAIEFRDPWTRNHQKPWWVRSRLADAVDARLELLCLRTADHVVSVSDGIHAGLLERLPPSQRDKCVVVRNGIERLASPLTGDSGRIRPKRILHLGTFSYGRDPRPFLRGLASLASRVNLGPEALRVDFVGQCRWFHEQSLERYVEELGIAELVHFQDWVPREDAAVLLERADALLLLAQDQPDQVPNKLYEYLGTRKPVIAFADRDGESARMLQRVGGHVLLADDDVQSCAAALHDLLCNDAGSSSGTNMNEMILMDWTTERQMRRLLETVTA
jgi:glycosyltransferase involved in cell wall biosynthesis